MKYLNLVVIATLLMSASTFAAKGSEGGNGGDIFYCPRNSSPRATVVDLYETRDLAGRRVDLGPAYLSYMEKVEYVLKRWKNISPLRVARYREWLANFKSEATFMSGISLPSIPDLGFVVTPKGCQIRQIAVQRPDSDVNTLYTKYVFNKDLWDELDEDNRAVLVLHELIYREAIIKGATNSLKVRTLNGILISKSSTPQEYLEASRKLNGLFFEWGWGGYEERESEEIYNAWVHTDQASLRVDGPTYIDVDTSNKEKFAIQLIENAPREVRGTFTLTENKLELTWNDANRKIQRLLIEPKVFPKTVSFENGKVTGLEDSTVSYVQYDRGNPQSNFIFRASEISSLSPLSDLKYSLHLSLESTTGKGLCEITRYRGEALDATGFHTLTYQGLDNPKTDGTLISGRAIGFPLLSDKDDPNSMNSECRELGGSEDYTCFLELPAEMNCRLHTKGGSELFDAIVRVKDVKHLRSNFKTKYQPPFVQLLLPAGQVVGRDLNWSGSVTETKLDHDEWVNVRLFQTKDNTTSCEILR